LAQTKQFLGCLNRVKTNKVLANDICETMLMDQWLSQGKA